MEDNQATITILLTRSSNTMRHTERTQKVSFAWPRQQFELGNFLMLNADTREQVADIFTKPFTDRSKWQHALRLIVHNDDFHTSKVGATLSQQRTPLPRQKNHLRQVKSWRILS